MKPFTRGRVYFTVSFLDTKLVYPMVDALVYLGKNLLNNESEDTWYFQDTSSYSQHGPFTDDRSTNAQVMTFTASRLDDVLDIPALSELLSRAAEGRLTEV